MIAKKLRPKNLREYQRRAIRFLYENKHAALFLDMGLGKTISVLSLVRKLLNRDELNKPILLIGPIRVIHGVWRQEAKKWTHTEDLSFSLVHGNPTQRMAALAAPAHIYLMNPENVKWLVDLYTARGEEKEWPFSTLVIDESSLFKSSDTIRFKKLRKVIDRFDRRIILTGTPSPNTLLDLWSQMFLLDLGERLESAYYRYKSRYFETADYSGFTYRPKPGAERHIQRRIRDITLRLDSRDWLEMPRLIKNIVEVELPRDARVMYERLEKEMFLELETADVEALNAASLSGRCHQIANGAVYAMEREGERNKVWMPIHDAKLDALAEIIEETSSPVMVAYTFRHDLARLRAAYPNAPVLGSGVSGQETDHIIRSWNERRYPILLVHPQSAGHGLNMQAGGHTLVYFSLPWSLEQHDQLNARLYRQGQENDHVIVHYIKAVSTVDEVVMVGLDRKATTQRGLLDALREYQLMKDKADGI